MHDGAITRTRARAHTTLITRTQDQLAVQLAVQLLGRHPRRLPPAWVITPPTPAPHTTLTSAQRLAPAAPPSQAAHALYPATTGTYSAAGAT